MKTPNPIILALDLGTDAGRAIGGAESGLEEAGTWHLANYKEVQEWGKNRMRRRQDPRVMRFFFNLRAISPTPNIVVFEDVQFHTSTAQTQLWSSFRAAVWCAFPVGVLVECVPTGTLKKFATGHGGATKEMMAASLFRLCPELKSGKLTDDAIDAIWLWRWAAKHLRQAV